VAHHLKTMEKGLKVSQYLGPWIAIMGLIRVGRPNSSRLIQAIPDLGVDGTLLLACTALGFALAVWLELRRGAEREGWLVGF
jgi:hypothetical protein